MPSNLPFAVPLDSPWFDANASDPYFQYVGTCDKYPFRDYANWPAHIQAEAAAMAAMEWHLRAASGSMWGITWKEASDGADSAINAFAAARERMKGGAT